jgi:hypothetical protein
MDTSQKNTAVSAWEVPGDFSTGLAYVLAAAAAVFVTFLLHEAIHWVAGELLGNDMRMTLNSAYPVSGSYLEIWHTGIVSAAGPLFTLIQAVVVYLLMQRNRSALLYPFLLSPFLMRVLALFMNFINPQDEGRISQMLGLGLLTLPILVCTPLFFLTLRASQRRKYGWKLNAISVFLIILFSSILILASQM